MRAHVGMACSTKLRRALHGIDIAVDGNVRMTMLGTMKILNIVNKQYSTVQYCILSIVLYSTVLCIMQNECR